MPDTVPAKLTLPVLDNAIERPRLFARLDAAGNHSGVWIEAPPGAGKTILVATYLACRDIPYLWYRVDATDHDIGTFLHHMRIAASVVCDTAPDLPRLGSEHTGKLEVFARNYFRALFAGVPAGVLVIDDCHEVRADSLLHDMLAIALAEAPAGHRLMLLSRSRPPRAYARLRSARTLELVEPQALRLTEDEATALCHAFAETHGLEPSTADCAGLHRRCDGWVTGMVLMLETWRTRGLSLTQSDGGVPEVVFDYFASEILSRADPDTERLLINTAMLEDITAELAVMLSGVEDAADRLDRLSHRGRFVVRHLGATPTWRCHQLFRQFLTRQAVRQLGAETWSTLRSKAAAALAASGRLEQAVEIWRQTQDWEHITAVLCQHAPLLLAQGRPRTLLGWSNDIPGPLRAQAPWLLYWSAVARMQVDPAPAAAELEQAFRLFRSDGDIRGAFLAWAMSVQNIFFAQDDYCSFGEKIRQIEPLLQHHDLPEKAVESVVYAGLALCVLLHDFDHPCREQWIERALALQGELPDLGVRIQFVALAHSAFIYSGASSRSQHVLETLHAVAAASPTSSLAYTTLKGVQSLDHWIHAEFDACTEAVQEGLAAAESTGAVVMVPLILSVGSANALSLDDRPLAIQYLKEHNAQTLPRRRQDRGFYQLGKGWEASLAGDWLAADDWLARATATLEPLGAQTFSAQVDIVRAVTRHHLGDSEGSAAALARARQRVGAHGRWILYGAALAEAEIALDRGHREAALRALSEGLAIGREAGLWNFTGWRREVLSRLCGEALAAGIERSYTLALIERHGLFPPRGAGVEPDGWPWALVVRSLGGLELVRRGHPVRFSGKVPRKPLQLLELLVVHGGNQVPEDWLADALWPDADGDAAIRALSTNIGRLRQLLEIKDLLVRRNRCLTLDRRRCWVDTWALEEELRAMAGPRGEELPWLVTAAHRVTDLCRGPFMPQSTLPATLIYREGLLRRTVKALDGVAKRIEAPGQPGHAREIANTIRHLAGQLVSESGPPRPSL